MDERASAGARLCASQGGMLSSWNTGSRDGRGMGREPVGSRKKFGVGFASLAAAGGILPPLKLLVSDSQSPVHARFGISAVQVNPHWSSFTRSVMYITGRRARSRAKILDSVVGTGGVVTGNISQEKQTL